jgi:AraC-like DNA-binding protein
VADFLTENMKQPQPTLTKLAQLANRSVSSLKVKLKQYYDMTIKTFFITEKVRYARSLLRERKAYKKSGHKDRLQDSAEFFKRISPNTGLTPFKYN